MFIVTLPKSREAGEQEICPGVTPVPDTVWEEPPPPVNRKASVTRPSTVGVNLIVMVCVSPGLKNAVQPATQEKGAANPVMPIVNPVPPMF